MALELAFDASLIPQHFKESLPAGLELRPLCSTDYRRSHFQLLATLTNAPDIGQQAWLDRFNELKQTRGTYFPVVVVDVESDQLVASGTLVLERKFIRGAGLVGHIEDIAVSSAMQGKGLGKKVIETLVALGDVLGAYKIILDCNPKNEAFYVKCGFETKGLEMARYNIKP